LILIFILKTSFTINNMRIAENNSITIINLWIKGVFFQYQALIWQKG